MRMLRSIAVRTALLSVALMLVAGSAWGMYAARISDLHLSPAPQNPIKIWGKVTSESPLKLSDGRAEITVTGGTATLGQFLVLEGSWNGKFFSIFTSEMVQIPAGSFLMGNSSAGDDAPFSTYSDEVPQHSVSLSAYYIGKYKVTRGEYRAFMNAGGYTNSAYWSSAGWSWKVSMGRTQPQYWDAAQNWGSGSFTQTDSYPVVDVSYHEAEAFCNWAGGHLPTEAQWERAARWTGTHPNIYPWGDTWNQEKCNNFMDNNLAGGGSYKFQTSPVGSYTLGASPCGCQDMMGNLMEWCQDWYKSYPGYSPAFDRTNYARVLRGADWICSSCYDFRCANRSSSAPYSSDDHGGFRLAR